MNKYFNFMQNSNLFDVINSEILFISTVYSYFIYYFIPISIVLLLMILIIAINTKYNISKCINELNSIMNNTVNCNDKRFIINKHTYLKILYILYKNCNIIYVIQIII